MPKRKAAYRRLAALVLLISFGGFGAHRFYLRRRGTGLAMLGLGIAVMLELLALRTVQFTGQAGVTASDWPRFFLFDWLLWLYQAPNFAAALILLPIADAAFGEPERVIAWEPELIGAIRWTLAVLLLWMIVDGVRILFGRFALAAPATVAAHRLDRRVALILLFFLGGFGLHRFYLGRRWSGALLACLSLAFLATLVTHAASAWSRESALLLAALALYGVFAQVPGLVLGPTVVAFVAMADLSLIAEFARHAMALERSNWLYLSLLLLLAIDAWLAADALRIWRGELGTSTTSVVDD